MRVDPTGQFWWIAIGAILGGLDAHLNGGDFMQGFVMGAVTGAIGAGVSSVVGNTAFGAAIGTFGSQVVGGAIAGGITGEMFGEGFWEGAKMGALSGAVAWGVQKWFGNSLDKWAGEDPRKIAFVNSVKRMAVGVGTGQDPVEAAGYGAVRSVANYYAPKIEATFTKFDEKNIDKVVILNNAGGAVGHNGILLIDKNGRGMFYSYYPETVDQRLIEGVPGEMRYKDLSRKEVLRLLLKDGIVYEPNVTTRNKEVPKEVSFEKYSRFIGMDVDPADGLKMFNKAQAITANPGTYKFLTNNCTQVVGEILKAGGYNYDDIEFNYIPNKVFENMKWQENVHVWQLGK